MQKVKILVADDQDFVLARVKKTFLTADWPFIIHDEYCSDYDDTMDRLKNRNYDVLVLDQLFWNGSLQDDLLAKALQVTDPSVGIIVFSVDDLEDIILNRKVIHVCKTKDRTKGLVPEIINFVQGN